MKPMSDNRPLIAHVLFRFDIGGLENGVANLINRLPAAQFRHAVIALTEVTDFRRRIEQPDVEFVSLHKSPGHGIKQAPRLYRIFRTLRPAIVHTRNLAALEASAPAWLAGVPIRMHGEHGWDVSDLSGGNARNRLTRRLYRPFVSQYVAMSADIERYLAHRIGISPERIAQIYNGVDTARFAPPSTRAAIESCPFDPRACWLVGTVGRMQAVKDQATLARAFARACALDPQAAAQMRLAIVGDGPEREPVLQILRDAGCLDRAWLPGARNDVASMLKGLDCFVLPSLSEGISNTILEAMATGLPVVATRVGGNPELIEHGVSGLLVRPGDVEGLAETLLALWRGRDRARAIGSAARKGVERSFSLERMVGDYARLYQGLLDRTTVTAGRLHAAPPSC
jgi:sugar transferase (PEP-CTERM/EpsH1 system associated)